MNEAFQKYERLLCEEDELIFKVKTYQQTISAILWVVYKRGTNDLHLLTIEEIISTIHSAEIACHSELLHLRLAKSVLSNSIG